LTKENLKQQWRVELGPSYSGPVVAGDRVFTTQTRDAKQEVVHAFDRQTGAELWKTEWLGALSVPFFARSNGSWIRSTPAVEGESLFVGGMRDVLTCLNTTNGETRWKVDFVEQFNTAVPAFGFVCSPLVVDGAVYVQAGASLAKVDQKTGEVLWRALDDGGGMWGSAFSSPVFATLLGKPQIIVQTRELLAGVDPTDGSVLWKQEIPAFRGMNILTPTVWNDSIFTSSYGGKSTLFRLSQQGEAIEVEEVWTNKAQAYMSSPVVYDDHLYLHLKNQRFTCIDLASGETRWTTTPFGKYWSMAATQDRLLALDQRGELLLIELTPEKFEELAKIDISQDETWAHLAVSGNQLFVRELGALAGYRWE
jgi:outer membrane protein assembly factor BamB